jgi:2-amino-4-hydroxy-6-hydroxymethyldihydropteridine diphosphokinase
MSQKKVVLLLGSNLGNSKKNIEYALSQIHTESGEIIGTSEMVFTDPVEFVSNNIFCNIAVLIKTQFSPIKLLHSIKVIERNMGRTVDSVNAGEYQDRIIDIDIVLYGNLLFWSGDLSIPHRKHLYERDFSKALLGELKEL